MKVYRWMVLVRSEECRYNAIKGMLLPMRQYIPARRSLLLPQRKVIVASSDHRRCLATLMKGRAWCDARVFNRERLEPTTTPDRDCLQMRCIESLPSRRVIIFCKGNSNSYTSYEYIAWWQLR